MNIPAHDFVEQIKVDGKKLCLVKHKGHIHVLQNRCPHAGGILSGGWCKDGNIVCPIHRYEYDLETGKGAAGQNDYVNIYAVEERVDGFYIGFNESWIKKIFS